MASTEAQKPSCPVCHQADQVKTTQAAYDSGVARCAPPDMPTKQIPLFVPFLACVVLVGIIIYLIIILIGSEANLSIAFQISLVIVALIGIVGVLIFSYISFQRVVQGDAEATERFPAWDQAMAAWRSLYYCARNDVVFDPKTDKVLSDEELAAIRTMREGEAQQVSESLLQKG